MEKLKQRWNIQSNFQLVIIFLVFTVNGSLSVVLVRPITHLVGMSAWTNPFLFWSVRVVVMFVIYQILLVVIGTLFGQHKFFWNMEKKMLSKLGLKRLFKHDNAIK
ncbi:DUF6787 family protein [Flagellimonas sp. S3867]|uniref:DUF6787 family protein n=1 Tax=Flagellimonas sp. S3867 TaxID=2768063 RepID=UPI001CC2252B|nr:DUF6787 family protein [Flagellimonas sp. S3867]